MPPARVKTHSEVLPLTGIRALAALWVIFYHMEENIATSYPALFPFLDPIISHGYLGVDLFFILSGFIIFYNYAERLSDPSFSGILEFLWARLARLWPVHIVVLLGFALLLWIQKKTGVTPGHPELYSGSDFVKNLFLVQGWGVPLKVSWNVPAWSVSCELFAYIIFPVLVARKINFLSLRNSLWLSILFLVATAIVNQKLNTGGPDYGIIRIAGEFTAGCALCHVFQTGKFSELPWRHFVTASISALLAGFYILQPYIQGTAYWGIPLLGLLLLSLAYQSGPISRLLSTRFFCYGGQISYSMYMIHELGLIACKRINIYLHPLILPVVNIAVIIVGAVFLFHFIEKPCRILMRRCTPRFSNTEIPISK